MVNMSDWFLLKTFYKWSAAYFIAFCTRNYFFSCTFTEFVLVSVIETYGVTVEAEGFKGFTVVTTKVFTICTFLSLFAFLPILPSFKYTCRIALVVESLRSWSLATSLIFYFSSTIFRIMIFLNSSVITLYFLFYRLVPY